MTGYYPSQPIVENNLLLLSKDISICPNLFYILVFWGVLVQVFGSCQMFGNLDSV